MEELRISPRYFLQLHRKALVGSSRISSICFVFSVYLSCLPIRITTF
jgi:hypothetical protein